MTKRQNPKGTPTEHLRDASAAVGDTLSRLPEDSVAARILQKTMGQLYTYQHAADNEQYTEQAETAKQALRELIDNINSPLEQFDASNLVRDCRRYIDAHARYEHTRKLRQELFGDSPRPKE